MAKVIITDSGSESEFVLDRDEATVGRVGMGNDIQIEATEASRKHCRLLREGDTWWVEDLSSSNGTRVNGRKVTKFELQDGDEIQVGTAKLRFLETSDLVIEEPGGDDGEIELEISLDEEAHVRFLNTGRADEKVTISERITFGRKSSNSVTIKEKGVSGSHCEIVHDGGEWVLRDLGSTNGTIVDGDKVMETTLSPGSQVRVGVVHFVFGVGENEGPESLRATTQMEQDDLHEEVFAISADNMRKKQKTAVAIYVVFMLIVAGSVYFWVTQGTAGSSGVEKVTDVTGNLVVRGASFELIEEGEDYLTTDSDAVEYEETIRYRHSGEQSLLVEALGGAGAHSVAFVDEIRNISSADRLEIGGWFRTSGLDGIGGLSLTWMSANGRVVGKSYLNAPPGSSKFVEVRGSFKAPFGTDKAAIGITVVDSSGKLYVDDVWALRQRADASSRLAAHRFDVDLDRSGAVTVSRDSDEVADAMGFYWAEGEAVPSPMFARFWTDTEERTDAGVRVTGELNPSQSGPGGGSSVSVQKTDRGIRWEAELASADQGLVAGLRVEPGAALVSIAEEGAVRHDEDATRDGVTAIVIGSGARAIRLGFAAPRSVRLVSTRAARLLLLPVDRADAAAKIAMDIQLEFGAEAEEARNLSEKAGDTELVQKKLGEAIKLYREVYNRFPFRQDLAERARTRHDDLLAKGEKLAKDVAAKREDISFFRRYRSDYEGFMEEAGLAAQRYDGTDIAARIRADMAVLKSEHDRIRADRDLETARNHLARGIDLMARGPLARPELAREFFKSVLKLAPESEEATRAKVQLEKVNTLVGGSNR